MRELFAKYGLTQARFSELTGIPLRTIQSWWEGKRTPPSWLPKMIDSYLRETAKLDK